MTDLLQVLLDMRSGAVAADCNEKFNEVLAAVLEVQASHEIKTKKPELEIGKAFFFVAADGTLSRDNPAQSAMFQMDQADSVKEKKNGRT